MFKTEQEAKQLFSKQLGVNVREIPDAHRSINVLKSQFSDLRVKNNIPQEKRVTNGSLMLYSQLAGA